MTNDHEIEHHFDQGWVTYMKHPVRNAGLGLAFLYMTVLGFDSITWSYCLLQVHPEICIFIPACHLHWSVTNGETFQGVTESTLGLLTGLSAVMGVAGARIFPIARFPNLTCLKISLKCTWIGLVRISGSDLASRRLAVSDFSGSPLASSSVSYRSSWNC